MVHFDLKPLAIAAGIFACTGSALALDLANHPSAICGGIFLTLDEIQKHVAAAGDQAGVDVASVAPEKLTALGERLEPYGLKTAKSGKKKIAEYLKRAADPKVRASATLLTGEEGLAFLKNAGIEAKRLGEIAGQDKIFRPWLIAGFGVHSLVTLLALPAAIEEGSEGTIAWTALMTVILGRPAYRAILRMRKSALYEMMMTEYLHVAKAPTRTNPVTLLSFSAKATSETALSLVVEEQLRAPYARQIVLDHRPTGMTSVERMFQKRNPFTSPGKKLQVDLIAFPLDNGDRGVLVLATEEN